MYQSVGVFWHFDPVFLKLKSKKRPILTKIICFWDNLLTNLTKSGAIYAIFTLKALDLKYLDSVENWHF